MTRRALPALLALAATLVGLLFVEYIPWREDQPLVPGSSRVPPGIPARGTALPSTDIQAQVAAILARPLFTPSRRPAREVAGTAGPAGLPRLSAVLVSSRGKVAVFAGEKDARPNALGEGARLGDYVVQAIGAGQVTLVGPDGVHVLRPTYDGADVAATAPMLAAAPAGPSILQQLLNNNTAAIGIPGLSPPPQPTGPAQ